ncbi:MULTISPECIES: carbohydrate-binding protein [Shewanella]|uniref:carbohydrate-binding protein n=1 Tax=Shewanella TaxID=22 RepID=UPI00128E2CFA|nr:MULTISPECIES: carbohydrate-binding protein [Shewanella]MPY22621.1 hypothetical protein [Shewanella sp. YLB-07]
MKNHISPLGAFRLKPLLYRSIFASSLLLPGVSQAVDYNSLVIWNGDQAYSGGAQVQHLDIAYSANWWTKGNDPEARSGPIRNGVT